MRYKIEIMDKPGIFDAVGNGVRKDMLELGFKAVKQVRFSQIYIIEGELNASQIKNISEELLTDKITQEYKIITQESSQLAADGGFCVEVAYYPGVMDPVEGSVLKGIRDMGIGGVFSVKTARKYIIRGSLSHAKLKTACEKLLYNKLIQYIDGGRENSGKSLPEYQFKLIRVDLLKASDKKLLELSRSGQLFLNLSEMRTIRQYFRKIKRNPTDCELETIAQTWSEHCYHKTFRGKIRYSEKLLKPKTYNLKPKLINGLLKSTIMKVTKELGKTWCVSVFKDNSGVIKFDDNHNICFKVETHNHPSALEPFGGANTGIGGVIRDPLGTGLGARPILNTDVFCFAPPDLASREVPAGALHPKRVMKGVVSGVRDYGNKMGIPTVNGAILFHKDFVGNPLVYCGTAGIMPKDKSFKRMRKGDLIVLVGGRTGRDGIHGATFSSGELTHESEVVSSGAVQIGNPIQEKKMVDTILQARDLNLYSAITDCGAGGLSSAVGEMAASSGAKVYLERVPLKYSGLSYMEIWISESQERMVLAVPPENIDKLKAVFSGENVEATVIGEFTGSGKLELYYRQHLVCELDMRFLHEGIPSLTKKAFYVQPRHSQPKIAIKKNITPVLLKLLGHYDICSKEWVVRQYDHEVQGGSVLKPLVGTDNDGPSDASIVKPLVDSARGIIVSNGINFRFGLIDPYWMAASCIDEALRQIIASGGSLKQTALLDNFCWGNPDKPERLGSLVRCAYGCYDTAKGFGVPFISGKDSLYNEFSVHGKSISIPGTLLISAISVMEDTQKSVSMYAKQAGNLIYAAGSTYDELGGSHYYDLYGAVGRKAPRVNTAGAKKIFSALSRCSARGLVVSMHDCSDGGLAVALAEMAFAGGLGMDIFLSEAPYEKGAGRNNVILFSESNSRFVIEVPRRHQKEFERQLKGLPFGLIGCLNEKKEFRVYGLDGKACIDCGLDKLKQAWKEPLKW